MCLDVFGCVLMCLDVFRCIWMCVDGPEGDCLRRVVRAEGGYEVVRELVGMPGDGMGSV